MKGRQVRQRFLDFFASRGHKIIRSSPLVPARDPTLLFVNAGMVQFKNVFLGREDLGTKRAVTSQKCLRVSGKHNDFENVGRTPRHHTFFEMLGNFSFGDYFKREAIAFAWEFVTKDLGINPDLLAVTVFEEDDEAAELWARTSSLPLERIVRMGEEENFWSMGDTGPCGPCSEIHYDLKPGATGGVGDDPERFLEIWNLVFMQYDRDAEGILNPLPAPSVDTGAGLERIAAMMQGVSSNFDTDLFAPIRRQIAGICGKKYGADEADTVSMRVICDHARALAFLVGDAVLPSNLGRGYVLRRIMRRAARHGVLLGLHKPFLYQMIDSVIEAMRDAYPELASRRAYMAKVIHNEEERFLRTLDKGLRLLSEERERISRGRESTLSGDFAFQLYDTFGFPLDLTQDIGRSEGFDVDEKAFNAAMERQRKRSARGRGSRFSAESGLDAALGELAGQGASTRFVGYDTLEADTEIIGIVKEGELVSEGVAGEEIDIVTDRTPFYAESGGQVGDTGVAESEGAKALILDTLPVGETLVRHRARVEQGALRVGDRLSLRVDRKRRQAIQRNHTATHLLHMALRRVLGEDAKQAGSLVAPDHLRFDFTHFEAVSDEELRRVEALSNGWVLQNSPVRTRVTDFDEAVESGATALFGEKYDEEVRVVSCGDSVELCGGTHVSATGDIGPILVLRESSIAAGVRRIEALSGTKALEKVRLGLDVENDLSRLFKVPSDRIVERAGGMMERVRLLEKDLAELRESLSVTANQGLIDRVRRVNDIPLLAAVARVEDAKALRGQAGRLLDKLGSGIVVLGAEVRGKAMLCAMVSKDLRDRFPAGKIIAALAKIIGGGGGGKPDMAQAGGPDVAGLQKALDAAAGLLETDQ